MSDRAASFDRFIAEQGLPAAFRDTVSSFYQPLASRIAAFARNSGAPRLVGICGPQASGKSTGVSVLRKLIEPAGLTTATLSLDDFYLTRAERRALAKGVHPLFATRGPPATHDMALCGDVIDSLLAARPTAIPVFDKANDDRARRGAWRHHDGPADIVLFEGWCVDAVAQPEPMLDAPINRLERDEDAEGIWRRHANGELASRYRAVFDRIDLVIQLRPPGFETVPRWRREQEAKLRLRSSGQAKNRTMNDGEIDRFVAHYERISRWIGEEMPARADILVDLNEKRNPIAIAVRPGGRLGAAQPSRP